MKNSVNNQSLLYRYQIGSETSIKCSDFIFYWVNLLFHKCRKLDLKWCGSYVDSLDWMKHKRATIYPINDNDQCLSRHVFFIRKPYFFAWALIFLK